MADNFDDGKGNGKEKDNVSLGLFKSAIEYMISDISSQLYSTNPAELARLNNIINSLLSSDLPPDIQTKLKKLQDIVVEKEDNAEQFRNSEILERNREEVAKWEEHVVVLEMEAERLEAERLLAQFHQEGSKFKKQHEKFKVDIAKRIEETKEETIKFNELCDYLSDENLKGKDIDQSKLRLFIKNEEQIERDRELYRHQKKAHKRYDELCTYDTKLKTEKEELKEVVKKEQQKPKELQSSTLLETTKQRIKHKDESREELKPAIAKAKAEVDKVDEQIKALEEVGNHKSLEELIDKAKDTHPENYQILTEFDSLIKNQENAIKNDEPVVDIGRRDAFLNGGSLLQEDKLSKNVVGIEERDAFLNDDNLPQENKVPKNVEYQQDSARQILPNDVNIPQNLDQDKLQKKAKDIVDIANEKFLSIKETFAKSQKKVTNFTYLNNTNNIKKDPKGQTR